MQVPVFGSLAHWEGWGIFADMGTEEEEKRGNVVWHEMMPRHATATYAKCATVVTRLCGYTFFISSSGANVWLLSARVVCFINTIARYQILRFTAMLSKHVYIG